MSSTRARLRELISRKVGGHKSGTVDLPPSMVEADSQRLILSTSLSHSERPPTSYSYGFAWVGRYNQGRQIVASSFLTLPILRLTPPASGPLTLTFWGYGEVGPLTLTGTASEQATQLQDAITDVAGLESVTVAVAGTDFRIELPSTEIAAEVDTGTIVNGIGQVEVAQAWRYALPINTAWEMSSKLPVEDDGNQSGLNWIVNEALSYCTTIAQVPYTPGDEKIIVLSEPWLRKRDQIHAIWQPYRRILEATFTPPGSGTYNLTFQMGLDDPVVVTGLAYDASVTTIAEAIAEALTAVELERGVAVEVDGSNLTIRLTDVYYYAATVAASAGTIVTQSLRQVEERLRFDGYKFVLNGNLKQIELNVAFRPGYSIEFEMSRPGGSWTCPQIDYQTLGTTWAASTTGLVYDLDQADVDEATLANIGGWLACEELAKRDPDNLKDWKRQGNEYAVTAAGLLGDGPRPTDANARTSRWGNRSFTKTSSGLVS